MLTVALPNGDKLIIDCRDPEPCIRALCNQRSSECFLSRQQSAANPKECYLMTRPKSLYQRWMTDDNRDRTLVSIASSMHRRQPTALHGLHKDGKPSTN